MSCLKYIKTNTSIRIQNFLGLLKSSHFLKKARRSNPTIQPYIPYPTSCKNPKTQIQKCLFFRSICVIVSSTTENHAMLRPAGIKHLALLSDKFNLFGKVI